MSRAIAIAALVLAACGGADKPAQPAKMSNGPDDLHALCVSGFQRQRECTAQFIPALVARRVELDNPPGIAAKDQEMGRDALVAAALEEWKTDSLDENIGPRCDQILSSHPPDQATTDKFKACMEMSDCQAFSDCSLDALYPHPH
jgi:hypothetical protein